MQFTSCLLDTDQDHIYNFIRYNGGNKPLSRYLVCCKFSLIGCDIDSGCFLYCTLHVMQRCLASSCVTVCAVFLFI